MIPSLDQLMLQFGALGLLGYVLYWMTRRLNGKLDRLTDAITQSISVQRETVDSHRQMQQSLEHFATAAEANRMQMVREVKRVIQRSKQP